MQTPTKGLTNFFASGQTQEIMTSTDDIPEAQYFPGVVSPNSAMGSAGRYRTDAYRFQIEQSQPIVISSLFT